MTDKFNYQNIKENLNSFLSFNNFYNFTKNIKIIYVPIALTIIGFGLICLIFMSIIGLYIIIIPSIVWNLISKNMLKTKNSDNKIIEVNPDKIFIVENNQEKLNTKFIGKEI